VNRSSHQRLVTGLGIGLLMAAIIWLVVAGANREGRISSLEDTEDARAQEVAALREGYDLLRDQVIQAGEIPSAPPVEQVPSGPAVVAGEQGATGLTGPRGFSGEDGTPGPTGSPGPTGAPGSQGLQGETGPQGLQGEVGPGGPEGPPGPEGPAGYPSQLLFILLDNTYWTCSDPDLDRVYACVKG
jgi:hypothetical protein